MHATMLHPRVMMRMFTRDTMPKQSRPTNNRKKELCMKKGFIVYFIFKLAVGILTLFF